MAFSGAPGTNAQTLQARLLALILKVSLVLGTVVYVPSIYLSFQQGLYSVIVADTIALGGVLGLLVGKRLPFRLRAGAVCLIFYGLGVILMIQVGSVSQIYLLGFSVITVLLLGTRTGLAAAVLSSVSVLIVGALGPSTMVVADAAQGLTTSLVVALSFALISVTMTLAIGVVLDSLDKALKREIGTSAQLQLQIDRMPLGYLLLDKDLRYTRWNHAAERMFGFTEAEVLGKQPFELIVPRKAEQGVRALIDRIKGGEMDAHGEMQNRGKAGKKLLCEWHNTPMFDEAGAFSGIFCLVQDVTERRGVENQLRQAQKMDAVGRLAGGIAHDFNNLLSVILSYSDLMLADLKPEDPSREDVTEIRRAADRAAGLTRQLLMFSRQQVVEPTVLDLNDVLTDVNKMLRRLIGEDIEFTSRAAAGLGHIRADRGSIEQVIVNLVVNARDAMPTGGKLTLETANVVLDEDYAKAHFGVKAGPHVMLAVTDTGIGMDKATQARIFEPFFTTKEKGKGTGLGLSTVFGIAQQSGGSVWLYSEPSHGTTFKVYLPQVGAAADVSSRPAASKNVRGHETILLVEDEDQVRHVTANILRRHGYTVLEAGEAGAGMLLSQTHHGRIDLLLTDVVMPKMSGPAMAKRLTPERPEMKVLCMSGYTDDAAVRHGVVEAEFAYLQKPISVETLTRKVRSVLDAV